MDAVGRVLGGKPIGDTITVEEIQALRLAAEERDRLRRENGRLTSENARLSGRVSALSDELDALQKRCLEQGVDPIVRGPMTVQAPFTDIPDVTQPEAEA